ncbi:hypothetical protein CRG98_007987 [Punica granatum]|nr:hypothetical protein CRG98_007987 [Punica granatum]
MDSPEDFEPKCFCGIDAKLKISHTVRNPHRLFYNCSKSFDTQCGFFLWADEPEQTGEKHLDELNLIRNECIRLQRRVEELQEEIENERSKWDEEKSKLTSRLSFAKDKLRQTEDNMRMLKESDLMPPTHWSCKADCDEERDAIIKHTV